MSSPTVSPRTDRIQLYQGDDLARIESLRKDVERAKLSASGPARVGDTGSDLAAAKLALQVACEEAEPRAVVVVVQHLGRRKFRTLVSAHPPRDGEKEDEYLGVNADTFPEALLEFVDDADPDSPARTIVEPEFVNKAAVAKFLDSLSDADYNRIFRKAMVLNRAPADDPKDLLAFEQIGSNSETLS